MSEYNQSEIAIILDRLTPTETMGNGFIRPEDIADQIDLEVAYKPILMPNTIYPNRAVSKLQSGNYVIYDVGYNAWTASNHRWDVTPDELRVHRARFRLQQDMIYQDMVMGIGDRDRQDVPCFFRHWTGGRILDIMPWDFRNRIIPLYFPAGIFIPAKGNPLAQSVIENYRYADGTIDVQCH